MFVSFRESTPVQLAPPLFFLGVQSVVCPPSENVAPSPLPFPPACLWSYDFDHA